MIFTILLWQFESSVYGCVERQFNRAPIITMFVGQLTMQLVLLFLFVLPMKKHASLAPEDARYEIKKYFVPHLDKLHIK